MRHFQKSFNMLCEAIDCAIDSQLHIVQITHDGHPYKTMYLGCLGTSLQRRFERFGEMDDIDRAIKFQLEAFDLTLDGHPEKLICLSNLGNFCLTRFKRIGELADIDKAIGFQLEAVDIAPDDHLDKPMYLSNLGNSFLARFQRLGEMVDVEKAIKAHRSAVQLTPNGHPSEPVRFSNLGNSHLAWFQHFGEMKDIERAIEAHLRAVELTPYGHPDKPMYFGNLGNSHLARFQSHGEMSDIDKAVDSQLNAIRLTPDDHPDKPMYLDNLGNSHLARFQHLGEVDDTDKAIEAHLSAVELTPNGHSNKPIRLSNLGTSYLTRFECLGEMKDIDAGIIVFELSATSLEGPPVDKFRAARKWISTLRLKEKTASIHGQGLQPQHTLISLIPDLVWLGTPVHQSLQTIQDVIASSIHEVVSDAIRAQELELAVEWMERGRSIIWSQLRRLRSPLVDLQDSCPSLAQEFQDVQRRIEMSFLCHEMQDKGESELSSLEHQRQNHRRDTQRRDELLAEIRSKHGFERFLMPETFSVLSKACQGHLVVLLTVFEEHCDALIILPSSSITHLSFTEVTQGEINRLHAWWDSSDKDDSLAYLLSYVWTKIVQPIIEEIESVLWHLANDNVARIIWCPSGPLSFLPLHAAGNYGRDPQDHIGISDFAVSSYTPSLMALLSTPVQLGPPSMLLVPLPGAIPEAENIMQKAALNNIQPYIHHLSRSQATVSAVIKHLKSHSWVHLACHGVDKYPDPMESSFHLHDGCLTLAMLMQNSIRNAQFAFLSACQTATGERTLSDESMHLTSGMLAAGFPSVVGTMWSIQDTTTPEVAEAFYAVLFEEGQKSEWKMKPEPAYALHFALRSLRAQGTGDRQLMKWVPFVHYGI
ncbi:CHAT domain-containing protein [Flagelloscypha sp. PMI_526]|nr:CHAT domain-containing protein [Flagelloscypha sp. PMI_526]